MSSFFSPATATFMSRFKQGEPVYYITPIKARYTDTTPNYGPGYELIVKMHSFAVGKIPIKVYKGGPGSKHIDIDITCQKIDETSYPQIRAHILGMKCGALNNGYILSNFNKDHTCSILQYIKDITGTTRLNTIIVFGYSAIKQCPEIIAICSQGGGGNPFNYFLNLAKAALNSNGLKDRFQFKVVLEALLGAQPFYRSFNFLEDGQLDIHGSMEMEKTLSRSISVTDSSQSVKDEEIEVQSGEIIEIADAAAKDGEEATLTKAKTPEAQQESTVAIAAQKAEAAALQAEPAKKRKNRDKTSDETSDETSDKTSDETSSKYLTLGYGRYLGTKTAGGNMNKIKNKTVNVLFRPFRILTKGSVKKSNKKRSKRRITNKRKTRKNN